MELLFLICAVAGGTILVIQVLLLLIGFDSGPAELDAGGLDLPDDVDLPEDSSSHSPYHVDSGEGASGQATTAAFKFLSLKTLVAFFTFFGLSGLLALQYEVGVPGSLAIAILSGLLAFYVVGYVWMLLYRLQSSGNVHIQNAVGKMGRVYLQVPGNEKGRGKVTVEVQGRTLELHALTDGDEIPTGGQVRVVGVAGSDVVKVLPVEEVKEVSHG